MPAETRNGREQASLNGCIHNPPIQLLLSACPLLLMAVDPSNTRTVNYSGWCKIHRTSP